MSGYEAGEAFVKIRPLAGPDFAQQITAQVNEGLKQAEEQAVLTVETATKRIADLQARAQAQALRGDETGSSQLNAVAQLQQVIFAAQQARAQAVEMVSADQAAMRDLLLASAEAYDQAAVKLREMIAKSQQTGRPVVAPGAEEGGVLARIEQLARGSGGGSRGGIGGLLAGFGRAGLAGGVAIAAFQGLSEVSRMLRVTGDEAYTAQGKVRNFGAELLQGNLIGGIRALAAERPAQIVGELNAKLEEQKAKVDPLVISQEKLLEKYQRSPEELQKYLGVLVGFGKISVDTAIKMEAITKNLDGQVKAARAAEVALGDYNAKLQESGGLAAAVSGPDSGPNRPSPGAIAAANAQVAAQGGPTPAFRTGGADVGNQIRASITSRIADDVARAKQEVEDARIIQAQRRQTFENVRHTEAAAGAWKDYVDATTEVTKKVQAAQAATATAAAAAQSLADQVRESAIQTIADPMAQLNARLNNALIIERRAKKTLDETKKGTDEYNKALGEYQIAVNNRKGIEVDIAKAQGEATKQAQQDAADAKDRHQAAVAAALENNLAAAELAGSKAGEEKAFADLIAFWKSVGKNASDDNAREDAQAKVIALRARRKAFREGDQDQHTADELIQLQIQNRIDAAKLTPGLADDKKFAKQMIDYWRDQVKNAEGFDKEQKRSRLIAARLALQALNKQSTEGDSPDVFVRKLYESAADQFRRFGSNISSTPGMLAPQDARGELAGILMGGRDNALSRVAATATAQLSESKKQTAILQVIAGGPVKRVTGVPLPKATAETVANIAANVLGGL